MKGINISCASQTSTSIISSTIMDLQSPTSSSSSSSSTFAVGGRAIDRHNPIITDERRRGPFTRSAPTTPCATSSKTTTYANSPLIKTPGRSKKCKKLIPRSNINNINRITKPSGNNEDVDDDQVVRKSFSKPSDLIVKAGCNVARRGADYISPPESSRYLLDDTSFLDVLSDFDPVLKLVPFDSSKKAEVPEVKLDAPKAPKPSSLSSGSSDQVVVLRVSLHCRGCERKMKKHLSRMAGVKSFNIDFTAKKVTVIGDVTPLGVLTSISKVKNAQLWKPTMSSSYPISSRSFEGLI